MEKKFTQAVYVKREPVAENNPYHPESRNRLDRLFCSCGFQGKPAFERVVSEPETKTLYPKVETENEGWGFQPMQVVQANVAQARRRREMYEDYSRPYHKSVRTISGVPYCPQCGEREFIVVDHNSNVPTMIPTSVAIFDDRKVEGKRDKIVISFTASSYYYNMKKDMVTFKREDARIVYNCDTHRTWICVGKKAIREATYGAFAATQKLIFSGIAFSKYSTDEMDEKCVQGIRQWMALCAEARGLKYIDLNWFFQPKPSQQIDMVSHFAIYLKFPFLQNLPFKEWGWVQHSLRDFLKKEPTTQEIWQFIAGSSSRQVRKYITDTDRLAKYVYFSQIFKEPDNLMRILWEDAKGGQTTNKDVMTARLNKNPRRGEGVTHVEADFSWIMKFHRDEAHLVRAMMKIKRPFITSQARGWDIGDNNALVLPELVEPEHVFDIWHAHRIVQDTIRLGKGIEDAVAASHEEPDEENPPINYEFIYDGDLTVFHDNLSRDFGRMRHRNRLIRYTNKELSWQMCIDRHEFILARDTHTLIDTGNQMNICVGGYGEAATSKRCTIMNVYKDGELKFCIEVDPAVDGFRYDREAVIVGDHTPYSLRQVKKHYNRYGTREELQPVVKWLDMIGIPWKDNYDMTAATGDAIAEARVDVVNAIEVEALAVDW